MNTLHFTQAEHGSFVTPAALALATHLLLGAGPAHAQWFGSAALSSDHVIRAISQSAGDPSAHASLGWRHGSSGVAASLGLASVSPDQFAGGDGYKLLPELGWSVADADPSWRAGVALRGQYFPGARGPWFGNLPPAVQNRLPQTQERRYDTLELGATLGFKWATFSWTRSLTDYLGLAATDTGPLGTRLLESKGTIYLGLDFDWPVNDQVTLRAGVGQLQVPNFEALGYTDWRVGINAKAWDLNWSLAASGSNAPQDAYRPRLRNGSNADSTASTTVTATVAWVF